MDECIKWDGWFFSNGYPGMTIGGRSVRAHRQVFERANGRPPEGVVRHTCDNKWCVNPDHLIEGTQAQNIQDAVERDRYMRGSRHGMAKLSASDVLQIRERYAAGGVSQSALASEFGVSQRNVSLIVRGEAWSDPRIWAAFGKKDQ